MTENTAASAPGPSAGSADWKAYALRVQRENEELRHDINRGIKNLTASDEDCAKLESELAAIKAEIAAAGKELPCAPHPFYGTCSDGTISVQGDFVSARANDAFRQSATAIIATREATIRELEAKVAGMGVDAERYLHARNNHLSEMLEIYPTTDTSDVGLDYAIDAAREADGGVK